MSSGVTKSLRGHLIWAFVVIAGLAGGLGTAAALVEISGAVIAPGNIVVETNLKRVQHQEVGIVEAIHVGEGQPVEAGDLLVRLDGTIAKANLAVVTTRLRELQAQEARLMAERDGQEALIVPETLAALSSTLRWRPFFRVSGASWMRDAPHAPAVVRS